MIYLSMYKPTNLGLGSATTYDLRTMILLVRMISAVTAAWFFFLGFATEEPDEAAVKKYEEEAERHSTLDFVMGIAPGPPEWNSHAKIHIPVREHTPQGHCIRLLFRWPYRFYPEATQHISVHHIPQAVWRYHAFNIFSACKKGLQSSHRIISHTTECAHTTVPRF